MCKIIALVPDIANGKVKQIVVEEQEIAVAWSKAKYWNSKGTPVTFTVAEYHTS